MIRDRNSSRLAQVFVLLAVALTTFLLLPSPGTGDMLIWVRWINQVHASGLVNGYRELNIDYPPLALFLLVLTDRAAGLLDLQLFYGLKSSFLLFLSAASVVFWLWTRNFALAILLQLSLLLNTIALGYIDIYFGLPFILSLWALDANKLVWFAVFFMLALLVKLQPLIIMPFIVLYLLNIERLRDWRKIEFRRLLIQVLLPMLVVLIVGGYVFHPTPLWDAFNKAFQHNVISGNALNLGWVITHWLHVFEPAQYSGLVNGEARLITITDYNVTILPRLLLYVSYLGALLVFLIRPKTFENLILFSLIGFLAYITFNIGVHENHLFLAGILAIVLLWLSKKYVAPAFVILFMMNLNLFLFYGVNGSGPGIPRVPGGFLDMALVVALFNVAFFVWFWFANLLPARKA